jgi:hypothetical protein
MSNDPDEEADDIETDADGAQFGQYVIRLVNPEEIRHASLRDEYLMDFAIHADLPNVIPQNEIWLSNTQPPEEQVFHIAKALFALRQLAKGLSRSDAYQCAAAYQKSLCKRHAAFEHRARRATIDGTRAQHASIYKRKLGVTKSAALTVQLVDEPLVRHKFDPDFVEGGNAQVYSFIPADEIWVSSNVAETDRNYVALHEFVEQHLINDYALD